MTMKKTYINPSLEIINEETQQFMMLSTLGTTEETSGNLGREFDLDDEE